MDSRSPRAVSPVGDVDPEDVTVRREGSAASPAPEDASRNLSDPGENSSGGSGSLGAGQPSGHPPDPSLNVEPEGAPADAGESSHAAERLTGDGRPAGTLDPTEVVTPAPLTGLEEAQTVITDANRPELPLQSGGGGTPAEIAKVLLGHQLDHFELESLIGSGGMGAVFRARDTRLDRIVAIKVIPRVGDDPELLRRFRNEAQSAARLDHPSIARVYDVGRHQDWHYIVFEYIEGTNLRDLVARDGLLEVDDAIYYTRQVAEALDHAHRRGVTHRDIKPSNVLVTPDGVVKLVDMGLARAQQLEMSEDMTASGVTLGTFDYISPEQARDPRNVDVRSDIYSLGCTLYFVLTGRPPYPSGTVLQKLLSHGSSPPPDPRLIRGELSENLVAVLHKMLAKQPNDRYRKPLDLISDLYLLAERENLPRALSAGSIAIAPDNRFSQLVERHLPWLTAAALLLAVTAWLQLLSSAGNDLPITEPGPSPARTAGTAEGSRTDATAPAPLQGERGQNSGAVASEDSEASDPASSGPRFGGIPEALMELSSELRSGPAEALAKRLSGDGSPTTIRVIGPREETASRIDKNNRLLVTSLEEALEAAKNDFGVTTIEIAAPLVRSGPVRLPRPGLTIRGTGEANVLSFVAHTPAAAAQHSSMFELGRHSVDFENLHLLYRVPAAAVAGGAMFSLEGDNTVRFTRCSITVENTPERDAVYAFETRLSGNAAAEFPPAAAELPGRAATPSPPLVAIQLNDSVVRGQMSMLAVDSAALVQIVWDNGLLAVSRQMIESGDALARTPLDAPLRMTLQLSNVTAAAVQGLVALELTPDTSKSLLVDRIAQNCAFTLSSGAPLVEMRGLADLSSIERRILLRGRDNYYDSGGGGSELIVRATSVDGGRWVYSAAELLSADKPPWVQEASPQGIISWARPVPPELPEHLQTPAQYLQRGVVTPGFQLEQLPDLPEFSESLSSAGI